MTLIEAKTLNVVVIYVLIFENRNGQKERHEMLFEPPFVSLNQYPEKVIKERKSS